MRKQEFLDELARNLSLLPLEERSRWLRFYEEIIDDGLEGGLDEDEIIASFGNPLAVASRIWDESGRALPADEKRSIKPVKAPNITKPHRGSLGKKIAYWATSVIWIPLAIAALCIVFALWVSAAAIVASLWVVFAALTLCIPLSVGFLIFTISTGSVPSVLFNLGTLFAAISLAILSFYASYALTRLFKKFTLRLWDVTARQVKRIATYPFDKRNDPAPAAPHDSWSLIICDTAR